MVNFARSNNSRGLSVHEHINCWSFKEKFTSTDYKCPLYRTLIKATEKYKTKKGIFDVNRYTTPKSISVSLKLRDSEIA